MKPSERIMSEVNEAFRMFPESSATQNVMMMNARVIATNRILDELYEEIEKLKSKK